LLSELQQLFGVDQKTEEEAEFEFDHVVEEV
jgi:hypothetical protein